MYFNPCYTAPMKKVLLLLFFIVLLAIVWQFRDQISTEQIQIWFADMGILAPVIFILFYAVITPLFIPGIIMTLAGGALFGPILGTVVNLTGATIGATFSLLVARYFASDWVESKVDGRAKKILDGVNEEGWRFVAFTRLVPLFPFNLLNYVLGLTKIPILQYILATWLFMLPAAFAYTYLGHAGAEAIKGTETMIKSGIIALALIAVVAFIPRIIKKIK